MANALPLLLAAGAVAVLVSKKKKKTAKKTNGNGGGELLAFTLADAKAQAGKPINMAPGDMVRFDFEQPLPYEWKAFTEAVAGDPTINLEESRPSGRYMVDIEAIKKGKIALSFHLTRFNTETADKIDLILNIA